MHPRTQKGPVALLGAESRAERREGSRGSPSVVGPVLGLACTSGAWVNGSPHPSCVEPQGPTAPGRQHTPPPHASRSCHWEAFQSRGCRVPAEAAACPRPAEGPKSWEQSPGQPGQHLVRRPKGGWEAFRNNVVYFSIFKQV